MEFTPERIGRIDFFADLSPEQCAKIAEILRVETVERDHPVIEDGASGDTFYLLLQGQVEISKNLFVMTSGGGISRARRTIIRLESKDPPPDPKPPERPGVLTISGDFAFGEMALFDPESKRSADVIATTRCTLGVIDNESFVRVVESDIEIGSRVYKRISAKLSGDLSRANQDVLNLTTALSFALHR